MCVCVYLSTGVFPNKHSVILTPLKICSFFAKAANALFHGAKAAKQQIPTARLLVFEVQRFDSNGQMLKVILTQK